MENIATMDSQGMEVSDNEDINFLTVSQSFEERVDVSNGVNLLPEEMITKIFEYVEPYELLKLSEVCHKWNVIIKQPYLWRKKYQRKYKEEPKRYQWFVLFSMVATDYYDIRPVRQGEAHNGFINWSVSNQTNNIPHLTAPVRGYDMTTMRDRGPMNLRTVTRCTSRTKVYINKPQVINFGNNKLVTSIVNSFKPVVYTVEWVHFSGITHICNHHKMREIINNGRLFEYCTKQAIESALLNMTASNWNKVPIVITDYAVVENISFVHVISINQPIVQRRVAGNLISGIERKPKIFACSLPF